MKKHHSLLLLMSLTICKVSAQNNPADKNSTMNVIAALLLYRKMALIMMIF
jgi:hypothetical protein